MCSYAAMKIRSFLALMIVATLAPVIVFSTIPLARLIQAERDAAVLSMKLAAHATSIAVDSEWHEVIGLVRGLSSSNKLESGNIAEFTKKARSMTAPGQHILLYDALGRQLINTGMPAKTPPPPTDSGTVARIEKILASEKYAVSDLLPGAGPGNMLAALEYPVRFDDGTRYVLGFAFHVGTVGKALPARLDDGTVVTIYDRQGKLIASTDTRPATGSPAPPDVMAAIRLAESGLIDSPKGRYTMLTASTVSGWWVAMSTDSAIIDGSARLTVLYSATGLLLALLLAGAAALLFSARVTRAIARTGEAARHMGSGGSGGSGPQRLPLRSGITEVDRLDQNVYLGAHLLASSSAERERLLHEAQEARAVAEAQNRSKDEFLAMLGHELRNPMAPISTAAHLLRMPSINLVQVRQASDIIARQVEHMNHLVNDLLDVSRVTRGLITLDKVAVDMRAVVAAATEQTAAAVDAGGHALTVTLATGALWVRGDATRLVQVLTNLLVNAAKYSPPGSHIELQVGREGERLRLLVRDNGNGIDAQLLPRVFELFSQGQRTPDRHKGGLGLGLALVRKLVELHGGNVNAYSDGPGQGSRFLVDLPLTEAPGAVRQLRPGKAA